MREMKWLSECASDTDGETVRSCDRVATAVQGWVELFLCFLNKCLSVYLLTFYSPVVTICTKSFNIQQFYVLPTQCIYVFCVDLRTNSDYFPIQH